MQKIYPFKFLDAYTPEDKDLFFGREEEVESLYQMLFQSNILLVYGASGTGKTSLIQCGLAQRFQPHERLPVTLRRGTNINRALDKALTELGGEAPENDMDWLDEITEDLESSGRKQQFSPLQEKMRRVYQNYFKPVHLIFDQFEELYVLGTKQEQDEFIATVQELLAMEQPVKLIFSIREEYLGHLYEFEKTVPQLLRKKLRVEPMNQGKVQQVITGATAYSQSNIQMREGEEERLSAAIFDKIKGKKELTVQLPYLQVFLDKLYLSITDDSTRQADATFTMEALENLGDIGDVLSEFLEDQVKEVSQMISKDFPAANTQTIWKILSPFATLEGTKDPATKAQLYERLPQYDPKLIDRVTEAFVQRRIVRYSEAEGLYEVAHDSLAQRIAEKRGEDEIALLQARQLIKSQSSLKAEARELFSEKQLALIEPFRGQLGLSPEEQALIDKSYNAAEQRRNAKLRRQRKIIAGVVFAAVIAIGLAIFGIVMWQRAEVQTKRAENQKEIAEKQKKIAKQKEQEVKKTLKQLKTSQFNRINTEARQLISDNEYAEAVKKLKTAFKWANDSIELQQRIDSLSTIAGNEIPFTQLMNKAAKLENDEETWRKAMEKYEQAAKLGFNNKLAQQKRSNLQSRLNSRLAEYKRNAKEYLDKGETFKQRAFQYFIKPGLKLKPGDAELLQLKKQAEQ